MPYHGMDDLQGLSRKEACVTTWRHMRTWAIQYGFLPRNKAPKDDRKLPIFLGTGVSGVSYASSMAMVSGWNWAFLRKSSDTSHHGFAPLESLTDNYDFTECPIIITDDFVSWGGTIQGIWNALPQPWRAVTVGICTPGATQATKNNVKGRLVTPEFSWLKGLQEWNPFGTRTL